MKTIFYTLLVFLLLVSRAHASPLCSLDKQTFGVGPENITAQHGPTEQTNIINEEFSLGYSSSICSNLPQNSNIAFRFNNNTLTEVNIISEGTTSQLLDIARTALGNGNGQDVGEGEDLPYMEVWDGSEGQLALYMQINTTEYLNFVSKQHE